MLDKIIKECVEVTLRKGAYNFNVSFYHSIVLFSVTAFHCGEELWSEQISMDSITKKQVSRLLHKVLDVKLAQEATEAEA